MEKSLNRRLASVWVVCLTVIIFGICQTSAGAETQKQFINGIVAVVEGTPITRSELEEYIQRMPKKSLEQGDSSELLKDMLQRMIAQKLIELEAQAYNISVTEAEIDKYIQEVRGRSKLSEEQFQAEILKQGFSMPNYRKEVAAEILRSRVVSQVVRAKIAVSDAEVRKYLGEEESGLEGEEESSEEDDSQVDTFHVRQVYLPFDEDAARNKYDELIERLEDGESLEKVAGKYITDMGELELSSLKKNFQEAIEDVSPGEPSEPVVEKEGLYFFVADKVVAGKSGKSSKRLDTQEAAELRNRLLIEKYNTEVKKYLDQELPAKYIVEIRLSDKAR